MDYRNLGTSGLKVPALSFGTATFGGVGPLFSAWGNSGVDEARRLVDICIDAGATLFDSADNYSSGVARRGAWRRHQGPARQGADIHQDQPAAWRWAA